MIGDDYDKVFFYWSNCLPIYLTLEVIIIELNEFMETTDGMNLESV
jgi:hypothetical protein